jgi:hypothetical protein
MSIGVAVFLLIARVISNKEFNSDCRLSKSLINSSSPEPSSILHIVISTLTKIEK